MRKLYLLSLSILIWCGLTGFHLHAFAQNAAQLTSTALSEGTKNVTCNSGMYVKDVSMYLSFMI